MTDSGGPWRPKDQRPHTRSITGNPLLWVAILLAGTLGLWWLATLFPNALASDWSRVSLVQWIGWLVLLSAAIVTGRRFTARETFRNILIWTGVVAVLAVGYTFRDELGYVARRVRSDIVPSYPVSSGPHEMTLTASEDGSFYVHGVVNGLPMHFVIDTGATDIVLSPDDAKRIGLNVTELNYFHSFETAHGVGHGAPATVARLSVGSFSLTDVPVTVNDTPMSTSLLGLAFLKKLDSFEVRGDRLTLKWHGAAGR